MYLCFKKENKKTKIYNILQINDLDKFFSQVYFYYYQRGYKNIKQKIIIKNTIYIISIHLIIIIIFFIDWFKLKEQSNETNIKLTNYLTLKNLKNNFLKIFLFYFYFMFNYLSYFFFSIKQIISMKNISLIYYEKFKLKDKDLDNYSFNEIMNYLIELQEVEQYCRIKENITKFDIINRINRIENYIISLISNNIIDFNLFGFNFFTNYTYHFIKYNLFSYIFLEKEVEINKNIYNINSFKLKILSQIFFQIFSIPYEIIFKIIFYLYKNIIQIYKINERNWDNETLYKFKNYNELKHHFENRISKSYINTNKYLRFSKYKNPILLNYILKLLFIFMFILFFISLYVNINIINIKINNFNCLHIFLFIGAIIFFINIKNYKYNNNNNNIFYENISEKINDFNNISNYIENIPSNWSKMKNYLNYETISKTYIINFKLFLNDLISIIIFPILWLKFLINIQNLVNFIKIFSSNINGLGRVCSFSILNCREYKKIIEKNSLLYSNNYDKRFNEAKFINSMIYFEKYFLNKENCYKNFEFENFFNNKNLDDSIQIEEDDNIHKSEIIFDSESINLIINNNNNINTNNNMNNNNNNIEIENKKDNIINKEKKLTKRIIYEKYIKIKEKTINEENFYNTIYYILCCYNDINLENIIDKMYVDNINYINI